MTITKENLQTKLNKDFRLKNDPKILQLKFGENKL